MNGLMTVLVGVMGSRKGSSVASFYEQSQVRVATAGWSRTRHQACSLAGSSGEDFWAGDVEVPADEATTDDASLNPTVGDPLTPFPTGGTAARSGDN